MPPVPPGDDDEFGDVYGDLSQAVPVADPRRRDFAPWHHPVKQLVRDRQWAEQTRRLLRARPASEAPLRYFTLPGADFFDVRVLSTVCQEFGVRVEYFGFDAARRRGDGSDDDPGLQGPPTTAESALRQAGRVTPDSVVVPDRLETIVVADSQASFRLSQQRHFDVVNLDACSHLTFSPPGRSETTFDALQRLLAHQMVGRTPWLLFVTTRIDPALFGAPGDTFKRAIEANLEVSSDVFGPALADALGTPLSELTGALGATWSTHDVNFAKLYVVGFGKYLTQFFLGQPNHPARVELKSTYAHRVWSDEPDMLALAFLITPENPPPLQPSTGGTVTTAALEPERAARIARRVKGIRDLDAVQDVLPDAFKGAVQGTLDLLKSGAYDTAAWVEWLANHGERPVTLDVDEYSL